MSNFNSVNIFDDIQSLCKDFRRKLKRGERARIEDYLDTAGDRYREMLFQNLLHIDVEFRRRQQQNPGSEEYVARFPQFGRLIRQAFFESTMMSVKIDAETPADQETIVLGLPAARRLGDYELLRELGRGGFGVVYAAEHLQRGEVVALKTLPTGLAASSHSRDDADRLHKFRHEFRALSEVNHPNLVGMQTLEVDCDQWFFTMDLVNGVDFLEYVRPGGRLDEPRLRKSLAQLVPGIVALHERGIVHRDLKPSNVLVDADGHVVILDFGLVAELQQRTDHTVSMQSQNFVGTPRYAAPEQAAGTRSAAGDWYALGVMLYEALTGEAPFKGTTLQLIVKKQTEDAPQVVGRDGVPRDLAELVNRLLKREPDQRPDVAAICEAVGIATDTVSHDSTDSTLSRLSAQAETFLVGRELQLAELEQARRDLLRTKKPVVVFVRGRSGEGKTSLVEKFLEPLRHDRQQLVLSGRCYDRESVPFKAIDCVIDALVAHLRARSTDDVHGLLPSDIHMLAHLFPVLRRVSAIADRTAVSIAGIDSRQIRYRAFAALRELLITIGRSTPIVMFIDDLQWGDADSATALFELLQPPAAPVVMLLGSYRSDEADESPFLQQWYTSRSQAPAWEQTTSQALPAGSEAEPQEQRVPRREPGNEGHTRTTTGINQLTVEVTSLTEDQCLSLLAARLGLESDALRHQAKDLFQAAHGNPYFLEQLMEGFDAETGELQAVPLDEIIKRRLQRLPQEAKSLLEAIAVAGQAVKMEEAASVSDQSSQAFATITRMRSERLVRLIGSDEQQQVDTYHDKIREAVLERLEPSQRRNLHVRFGEYLERSEGLTASEVVEYLQQNADEESGEPPASDRIFDIAYHYHAAGDARGFAYQLLSGELSHRAYASEDAIQFLERARRLMPADASSAIRHRVYARLGAANARQKSFSRALACLDQAISHAPSSLQTARAYEDVAQIHATRATFSEAIAFFDRALRELGVVRPRGVASMLKMLPLIGRLYLLPRSRWLKKEGNAAVVSALRQWTYAGLTFVLFEVSVVEYLFCVLRVGAFAVGSRDPARFAQGISVAAGLLAGVGLPAGLGRYLREAERIADDVDDAELLGTFFVSLAIAHNASSDLVLADEECRRATPLLEKAGVPWAVYAHHVRRHIQQVIGTSSAEVEAGTNVLSLAESVGDVRAQCWGHYDIASGLARAGHLDAAKSRIDLARKFLAASESIPITESVFHCTEGYVLLQASEYEPARRTLERSWRLCQRSLALMEYNVRSLPQLIESVVGPRWSTAPVTERAYLKRLLRASRLALRVHRNLHPPIHRARGRAFHALGRRRRALRSLQLAIACAERLGADYDRARALLDLAAIEEEGRDENRREAIKLLKQQESVIPYAECWLLGDQYDEQCVAPALLCSHDRSQNSNGQPEVSDH